MDKNEAKKLKTSFKNHRRVLSWDTLVSKGQPKGKGSYSLQSSKKDNNGQINSGIGGIKSLDLKYKLNSLWLGESNNTLNKKNKNYNGLKIELKGRLRGAAKSRKLSNIQGSVKSQSIDYYIEYIKKKYILNEVY